MKKISFNRKQITVNQGIPKGLKVALVGAIAISTLTACKETDDCTTTSTDLNAGADLGLEQDPNTFCDND